MSAPPSKPAQPTATTFNERLNEQLINCLNVQTNVIQNLTQYSQHISLQLFEIKNIVEILSNRVLALQQQQQSHFPPNQYAASYYPNYMTHPPPPSHLPPVPHSVPQPPVQMRVPTTNTTAPTANFPFFSPNIAHSQPPPSQPQPQPSSTATITSAASLLSNLAGFQFSTSTNAPPPPPSSSSSSQTTITNTTPTKVIFPNVPKFGTIDTTNKQPPPPPASTISFPTSTTNSSNEKPANISPFKFGTGNMNSIFGTGGLTSGLPTFPAVTKQENHADENGEDEGEGDSYEPDNSSFKPIVQLSAVEVKTGEEDENILFCERGKLYRFDPATNQLKERGIGEIKILQHKTTNVCRILMRREQVLKLCANHQITSQMELKAHQGSANAFIWSAMDFADGEAKHETLCVRFKTDEQAKNFAKVFNDAKANNLKKSGDMPAVGKISLNDDTKSKPTANDDDVIPIGETKPSAEQIDRAKKLQLPSTFYLYENKEPCKGCPGCEDDSPPITSNENKTAPKKQPDTTKNDTRASAPQTPSTGPTPKTPLSSSENLKFSFTNPDKSQPQIEKQTSKEEKSSTESPSSSPAVNVTSQYDSKPSIFGNLNGGSSTSIFGSTTPIGNSNSSVFGGSASIKPATNASGFSFPGFANTAGTTTPAGGFQFSTPTAPATAVNTNTSSSSTFSFGATGNQPLFGSAPKFSFSDLAKQPPNTDKPISNGTEQRVFAGQGTLVFGTNPSNITTTTTTTGNHHEDDDGEGGGDDESYEPNVSFKPIVQLSAVDVKTGEEDENVLFCERGKLYRFDPESTQMKERGIGEMKILQHKTTNVCRILMRREQVLKLCANHQITSQMELKQHQGSENAYVWSAMDFADGEPKHETLCIRYKSAETAKKFLKQFNDAKQANAKA